MHDLILPFFLAGFLAYPPLRLFREAPGIQAESNRGCARARSCAAPGQSSARATKRNA